MKMTINHMGIDHVDYLTDHCNGERERLACVPVTSDGGTMRHVLDALEFDLLHNDVLPEEIADDDIKDALFMFRVQNAGYLDHNAGSTDVHGDDAAHWFRISW